MNEGKGPESNVDWAHGALLLLVLGASTALGEALVPYDDTACRTCHGSMLEKKFRHSYFKDGTCDGCHVPAARPSKCKGVLPGKVTAVPSGDVGWRFPRPEPKLCQKCHEGIGIDEPVHKSVKMGGCSICHDAHGSDLKKNLRLPQAQLCNTCHKKDTKPFVHEPVAKGECTGCHDPHNALENPMLKETRADLCNACHEPKELSPGQHGNPKDKRICLDCHVAHASDTKALLKPGPPPAKPVKAAAVDAGTVDYPTEPCAECHAPLIGRKVNHVKKAGACSDCHVPSDVAGKCTAPLDKGWKLKRPEPALCLGCHEGVQANTPLHPIIKLRGCTACHDPHGGEKKKLLKFEPEKLCVRCHSRKDAAPAGHTPVVAGRCVECHDPHSGDAAPLLKTAKADLCFECHKPVDLAPNKVVHTPFTERRCLDCHDVHSSDFPKQVRAEGPKLCLGCHDSKAPPGLDRPFKNRRIDLTRAVVHKPLTKAGCPECHVQTHSGPNAKLLKKRPPGLCVDCHDRKDTQRFVHGAVQLGDCPVCHEPHTSENPKLLREKTSSALCFRCHQDDVTGRTFIHTPVKKGLCLTCHGPHGADDAFNLKRGEGKAVCYSCHKEVDTGKVKHRALERYGCVACHDPHGTGNRFQLIKPVNALCTTCHTAQPDGVHAAASVGPAGHPVKGKVDPRRLDREFTCVSCHNPHGSDNPKLFYAGKDSADMCDACHGDRLGTNPEYKDIHMRKPPKGWAPDAGMSLLPNLDWEHVGPDAGALPQVFEALSPQPAAVSTPAAPAPALAPVTEPPDAGVAPPTAKPGAKAVTKGGVPAAGKGKRAVDAGTKEPETPPIPKKDTP